MQMLPAKQSDAAARTRGDPRGGLAAACRGDAAPAAQAARARAAVGDSENPLFGHAGFALGGGGLVFRTLRFWASAG